MYEKRSLIRTACRITFVLLVVLSCSALHTEAQQMHRDEAQISNPLLWEDLADIDILRVGNSYYYSASNMHYSPGAPILRSEDLVHWRYVGHSVPVLDFGAKYDMQGATAYVRGTWASFLGYRASNKTFYWGGCIDFGKTYLYTAPASEGPWSRHAVLDKCYYDAGLLVDDDTLYVAYGNTTLHVAQLSPDGTHEVREETVFETPKDIGVLEGSRFYKVDGKYYIFATRPADGEYVLRSATGPFGPYTAQKLVLRSPSPVSGSGWPHQGGIVQTPNGEWFYMAFVDAYPGGRIPVLAPLKWNKDGWPEIELVDGKWAKSYSLPHVSDPQSTSAVQPFVDEFQSSVLGPEWEWNHNPDNSKWRTGKGLRLQTASVTDDLYLARNTLTHRIPGPASSATVLVDANGMKEGDYAGLALFRDVSAWIGITRVHDGMKIVVKSGMSLGRDWKAVSSGTIQASSPLRPGNVWLRATADIHPGAGRRGTFSYSLDGKHFLPLGDPLVLNAEWRFFMGYRFALFNYATQATGGSVLVKSFRIGPVNTAPSGGAQ